MTQRPMSFSRTPLLASLCAAAVLTACGGDGGSFYLTLDGKQPPGIAHPGFSGKVPEQTRMAYEAAAHAGADMLELDMHMTKDWQPVARHKAWLSDSTHLGRLA